MCSVILDLKRPNYASLVEMQRIIAKFVVERGLIVGGGLAIHYALRLKGHPGIYDERRLPDVDLYSSDYVKDSNDMTKVLYDSGYEKVDCINAITDNTRRVRLNYEPFVDIEQLAVDTPTLTHEGMLIADPLFHRLTVYEMISMPFANEMYENMASRLDKDTARLKLLDQHYPIPAEVSNGELASTDVAIPQDVYVSGMVAYALYYGLAESPYKDLLVRIDYSDDKLLYPKELPKRFAHFDYTNKYKTFDEKRGKYSKYLPKSKIIGDTEVYDIRYRIMTYHTINGVKVLHLYSLLVYFLSQYFISKNEKYLQLVKSIRIMQEHAADQPKYDISYEPCGDIHNNVITQIAFYKHVVKKKPYDRPEGYRPGFLKIESNIK